jgi:hypothetical protein
MMKYRTVAAVLLLTMSIGPAAADFQNSAPALVLEVLYGPGGGPERFRADLQDELLNDLRARNCFPAVSEMADGGKLLLRVTLEAPVEETRDDLSLHGSMRNAEEHGMSSTTTTIRVNAVLELLLPWTREIFRSKKIRVEESYRPHFAHEDGSGEARKRMIRWLASRVAGYACKAEGKKLRKRLQEEEPAKPASR